MLIHKSTKITVCFYNIDILYVQHKSTKITICLYIVTIYMYHGYVIVSPTWIYKNHHMSLQQWYILVCPKTLHKWTYFMDMLPSLLHESTKIIICHVYAMHESKEMVICIVYILSPCITDIGYVIVSHTWIYVYYICF